MLTLPSVWLALPSFGRRCAAFRSDPCPSKSFASFSPVCSEMRCWRTSTLCSSTARVCSSMHSETARLWNVLALLKDLCHHVRHATDNFLLSWAHGKVSLVIIRSLRKSLIRDGHDKRPLLEALLWNIRDLLMDVSRDVRYKHIHNLLSCALEKALLGQSTISSRISCATRGAGTSTINFSESCWKTHETKLLQLHEVFGVPHGQSTICSSTLSFATCFLVWSILRVRSVANLAPVENQTTGLSVQRD